MTFYGNNTTIAGSKSKSWQANAVLWLEANDSATLVFNGSSIAQWKDKSGNNNNATQSDGTIQPTFSSSPSRVVFNKTTQKITTTLPATNGTMILATPNGTQAYGVNIPAGSYDIGARGGLYMPETAVVGQIITRISLSQQETDYAITRLRNQGGGQNYGTVTNFTNFWRNWTELTSFPVIDTSNATTFNSTWAGCSGLTSFPLLNSSKVTFFQGAWTNCNKLTSFPLINTSAGTNFTNAWFNCTGLTSFPSINTSSANFLGAAWWGCNNLTSFPFIDTSKVTSLVSAWGNCTKLMSFPVLDTSNSTTFQQTWQNCSSLTSFPVLNTSKGTNFTNAWLGCSSLTSFPFLNVAASTAFSNTWRLCSSLVTFPANFFNGCAATDFTLAFNWTALSQSSIDNILVSINSNNTSNGTFNQSGGSAPSATGQAAITAMRSRGWTVTVTGGF